MDIRLNDILVMKKAHHCMWRIMMESSFLNLEPIRVYQVVHVLRHMCISNFCHIIAMT